VFHCLRRLISPIAAMVAILAVGMATPARADLEIWLSESGTPKKTNEVASGSSSATYKLSGNLGINMTATDNSAGVGVSSATITNKSTSSVTVDILVGATGFAASTKAFNVVSSVSGTGAPSSFSFTSYVNNSNGQNATSGGAQGAGSGSNSGSQAIDTSKLFSVNMKNKYSMTEDFHIVLGKGESITFSATTAVPNPEPSSMAIAGIGALGLIGYGLRR